MSWGTLTQKGQFPAIDYDKAVRAYYGAVITIPPYVDRFSPEEQSKDSFASLCSLRLAYHLIGDLTQIIQRVKQSYEASGPGLMAGKPPPSHQPEILSIKSETHKPVIPVSPGAVTTVYSAYGSPSPMSVAYSYSDLASIPLPIPPHGPASTPARDETPVSLPPPYSPPYQPQTPAPAPEAVEDAISDASSDFDWDDLANLDEGRIDDLDDLPAIVAELSAPATVARASLIEDTVSGSADPTPEHTSPEPETDVARSVSATQASTEALPSIPLPETPALDEPLKPTENAPPATESSMIVDTEPTLKPKETPLASNIPEVELNDADAPSVSDEEHDEADAMVAISSEPMSAIDLPSEHDMNGNSIESGAPLPPTSDGPTRLEREDGGAVTDAPMDFAGPLVSENLRPDTVLPAADVEAMDFDDDNALPTRQDEKMEIEQPVDTQAEIESSVIVPSAATTSAPPLDAEATHHLSEEPQPDPHPSSRVPKEAPPAAVVSSKPAATVPEAVAAPASSVVASPPPGSPEQGPSASITSPAKPSEVLPMEVTNAESPIVVAPPAESVVKTDISRNTGSLSVGARPTRLLVHALISTTPGPFRHPHIDRKRRENPLHRSPNIHRPRPVPSRWHRTLRNKRRAPPRRYRSSYGNDWAHFATDAAESPGVGGVDGHGSKEGEE